MFPRRRRVRNSSGRDRVKHRGIRSAWKMAIIIRGLLIGRKRSIERQP